MQLSFLGGAGTVTGSKYLLKWRSKNILVDCGLFQGHKELRLRNWNELPVEPAKIDNVILTHAHIDHTGYIPLLVKKGFEKEIYATPATKDLCAILLPDSGYLQEEEAAFANKQGYSKHRPALPLYTRDDAINALKQFQAINFGVLCPISPDCQFSFHRAGHILGASFVKIQFGSKTLLFTGDLGRPNDPIMTAPEVIEETDYLVIESTYGDRLHDREDPKERLGEIIRQTIARGGTVVIPAFAVGRAQTLLYYLYLLKQEAKIPNVPIFLDSPMAINVTHLLQESIGDHKLPKILCDKVCDVAMYINTAEQSRFIDQSQQPAIIISASGMMEGGRILFHVEAFGTDPRNTLLFTGYQAEGTRGHKILNGEKIVKIHGKMIPIRSRIESISSISAHADYEDTLKWLSHFKRAPKKVFITHGEHKAALSLKSKIEERFGWPCFIPSYLYSEHLT